MAFLDNISKWFGGGKSQKAPQRPTRSFYEGGLLSFLEQVFGSAQNSSGVSLDEKTVLAVPTVYACNQVWANAMGSLPIRLYRNANGRIEEIDNDLNFLVSEQPCTLYNSTDWRSAGQLHIGLDGNFYSQIVRNKTTGAPENLVILNPRTTEPFIYRDKLYSEAQSGGTTYVLPADDVLHVRNFSSDGILGKSPIRAAAEAIGVSVATGQYSGKLLKNGAKLNAILKNPGKLSTDQVEALRKDFKEQYLGPDNAGGIPILQNGMELQAINLSPQELEIIKLLDWTREDIARVYGVPLHMVGDLRRSTNNNIEHQGIEWVTSGVRPMAKRWESELNAKLLGPAMIRQGYFFRFDLDALMRGDANARSTFYMRMFQIGALSQNDIRRLENLNPIVGGDDYYVQVNMAPTGDTNTDPANVTPSSDPTPQPAPAR